MLVLVVAEEETREIRFLSTEAEDKHREATGVGSQVREALDAMHKQVVCRAGQ
jgi:hypothetical protein